MARILSPMLLPRPCEMADGDYQCPSNGVYLLHADSYVMPMVCCHGHANEQRKVYGALDEMSEQFNDEGLTPGGWAKSK